MSYCAIEEAFTLLGPGGANAKKSKKSRSVGPAGAGAGTVVPAAPTGSDQETKDSSLGEDGMRDPDRTAERPAPANDILSSPPSNGRLESLGTSSSSDFFPMQGNNAEPEAWQSAFLLGDMSTSISKPSFAVDQKPTLWRSIQRPPQEVLPASSVLVDSLAPLPDEIGRRLDFLSKQLESLTSVSPMQNTAELFLFVAIGLLLLLAIDTLLRYATASVTQSLSPLQVSPLQVMSGGSYRGYGRGYGYSRRQI